MAAQVQVTSRDKVLLMYLPAIVILIVYSWIFTKQPMQQMRSLVGRINTATAKTPNQQDIASQENRVIQLYQQVRTVQSEVEPLRAEVQKLMGPWVDPLRRAAASEALAQLWGKHDMVLLDQDRLANADHLLSPTLARLVQHAKAAVFDAGPNLWHLQLDGTYPQLLSALQEISSSDMPSVPVALSMTNAARTARIRWKLVMWQ